MGRHSIPDPEDSSEAGHGAGDELPDSPYADDYTTGDHPADDYDIGYDTTDYDDGDYEPGGYDQPRYDQPRYDQPRYEDPADPRDDDYSDLEEQEAATTAFATTPAGPNRRDWESSEWTGSHRAITPKRRGISVSVIVALVTVVVVVGAVIAWRFFGDALSERSQAGAARCVAGEVAVAVVVDPSIADQITPLADKYNQSAAPVGDKCVKVGVKAAESDQVVNGFAGPWPGDLGEQPALWIPASSISEARLEASAGEKTVSDSRSLVTSPVMLAMRPQLKTALGQRNWGALPDLQSNATALDGINLPGWGSLKLALPMTGDGDATYLAAEAVASAAAPQGQPRRRVRTPLRRCGPRSRSSETTSRRPRWTRCSRRPIRPRPTYTPWSPPSSRSSNGAHRPTPRTSSPPGCLPGRPRWPTIPPCCWPAPG